MDEIAIERKPVWKWRRTPEGLWEYYFDGWECNLVYSPQSQVQRPAHIPTIDVGDIEPYKFEFKKEEK